MLAQPILIFERFDNGNKSCFKNKQKKYISGFIFLRKVFIWTSHIKQMSHSFLPAECWNDAN